MIIDFHTHTHNSHDGFTTPDELLAACKIRGIDAIAITEHDRVCTINPNPFADAGIEIIPGCEFTCDSGAHIIGLFVRQSLPIGSTAANILNHIRNQGGFALMPHPWKSGSGFMAMDGNLHLASQFDFIELINGGWREGKKCRKLFASQINLK